MNQQPGGFAPTQSELDVIAAEDALRAAEREAKKNRNRQHRVVRVAYKVRRSS